MLCHLTVLMIDKISNKLQSKISNIRKISIRIINNFTIFVRLNVYVKIDMHDYTPCKPKLDHMLLKKILTIKSLFERETILHIRIFSIQ